MREIKLGYSFPLSRSSSRAPVPGFPKAKGNHKNDETHRTFDEKKSKRSSSRVIVK